MLEAIARDALGDRDATDRALERSQRKTLDGVRDLVLRRIGLACAVVLQL